MVGSKYEVVQGTVGLLLNSTGKYQTMHNALNTLTVNVTTYAANFSCYGSLIIYQSLGIVWVLINWHSTNNQWLKTRMLLTRWDGWKEDNSVIGLLMMLITTYELSMGKESLRYWYHCDNHRSKCIQTRPTENPNNKIEKTWANWLKRRISQTFPMFDKTFPDYWSCHWKLVTH